MKRDEQRRIRRNLRQMLARRLRLPQIIRPPTALQRGFVGGKVFESGYYEGAGRHDGTGGDRVSKTTRIGLVENTVVGYRKGHVFLATNPFPMKLNTSSPLSSRASLRLLIRPNSGRERSGLFSMTSVE